MARYKGQKGPMTIREKAVDDINAKADCAYCGKQIDVIGAEYHSAKEGPYLVLFLATHGAYPDRECPGSLQNVSKEDQDRILALVEIAK